ncbi:MAG: biotin-dependent carboxyltransferase family protein [Paracoccaceae bacterium]|nr:biotin-dependent carboxyltransferase family protein [Paracoccaceae bacterium]
MTALQIERVGPAVSLQDAGRPGGLGIGLSRGGAADRLGYIAACALVGSRPGIAAVEMAGFGGRFRFETPTRFALAGATMRATLDGAPLEWNATHLAEAGSSLDIGAAEAGVYGYLLPGGGVDTPLELGGRGFHTIAGLGARLTEGQVLPLAGDPHADAAPVRMGAELYPPGPIRVMPGPQTALFPPEQIEAFVGTTFRRSPRANRQGVRLDHDGAPFSAGAQLTQVSDFISEGDIQMTGDGTPYVLLADCQTMGGYPRIGTVLPVDLPRIAQLQPGDELRFQMVSLDEAEALWQSDDAICSTLRSKVSPRVRDPREMTDLLSYDLIDRPVIDSEESDTKR